MMPGQSLERERVLARQRPDESLARFKRIALVLSGGGGLGAYQAGACAALEKCSVRPNWIAGTGIGAINAAIIAGNLPHERVWRLRHFWRELSKRAGPRDAQYRTGGARSVLRRLLQRGARSTMMSFTDDASPLSTAELRNLLCANANFERINSGAIRVVFGAMNLTTGAETFFDNDRHVLAADHVLASTPLPGLQPMTIERQLFGGSGLPVSALDDARPADTLCVAIDGYDPVPAANCGISRTAREIAAMRRTYDLRRRLAVLGERLPSTLQGDIDIRRCLSEASNTTMTILHVVHEGNPTGLAAKMADFSAATVAHRWRAGESDIERSLAHPRWLAPPPRLCGVVIHEMRGGVAAPPR